MTLSGTSKDLGKNILLTLAVSGVVVLAVTSPGLGYVLKEINNKKFAKYKSHRINQAVKRLEKQKVISIQEIDDKIQIKLLEKGKNRVLSYKLEGMVLKNKNWDKKWRIIIFDIPENKKIAREFLRNKMKELGFYQLQKSVLITPWKCQDEIDFIKHFYNVGEFVTYIEAESFDDEEKLKKYFQI